jgi:outer membrane protein assembly factor BamC
MYCKRRAADPLRDRGRAVRAAAVAGLCLLLGACASGRENPQIAYQEADSVDSLIVPPDLTKPSAPGALNVSGSAEGSAGGRSGVLPQFDGVRFVRSNSLAWLELDNASADQLVPRIEGFVRSQGLQVEQSDRTLGIVETGWAERYDNPPRGGLTGFFDSVLGGFGDPIYDRYQFQVEHLDGGGSRVIVVHRSAEEIAQESEDRVTGTGGTGADLAWQRGTGDPAVRAEMTKRLLVHLGMAEDRAAGVIAQGRGAAAAGGPAQYYESDWGRAWIVIADTDLRRVFARVREGLVEVGAEIERASLGERRIDYSWTPPADSEVEAQTQSLSVLLEQGDDAIRVRAGNADGQAVSGAVQKVLLKELTTAMGGDPSDVQQPADDPEEDVGMDDFGPPGGPN